MSETTTLTLQNIKGIENKTFRLDTPFTAFLGANGTGKSTAIQSLETVLIGKGFMKEPITNGKQEGLIRYDGTDVNGNRITIVVNVEQPNKHSFVASTVINGKLKTITDVKKIQELMGTYYAITSEDILNMLKYAEGRRDFINKYILPLLSDEQIKRLEYLQVMISDKKNKQTEGNLYQQRANLTKEIELLDAEIKAYKVTDAEKAELEKLQSVTDLLTQLENEYKEHANDSGKQLEIKNKSTKLNGYKNIIKDNIELIKSEFGIDYETINNISDYFFSINNHIEKLKEESESLYDFDKLNKLQERIKNGIEKKTQLEAIKARLNPPQDKLQEFDKKFNLHREIQQKIEDYKQEIKDIYSCNQLPAGLHIEEDGKIYLNGFELDATTNSETEIKLMVLELLCQITTSQWINLGDWNDYSNESRKKVLEISKKYNRKIVGQQVTSDKEVKLESIIIEN